MQWVILKSRHVFDGEIRLESITSPVHLANEELIAPIPIDTGTPTVCKAVKRLNPFQQRC